MIRITRVLALALASIVVLASTIQASALGAGFEATVQPDCVAAGQQLSIRVPNLAAGTVVSVRVNYTDSAPGGGTQYATGYPNAQGVFTATISIPTTAGAGAGSLTLFVGDQHEDAELGTGTFRIQTGASACPSPGATTIFGSHFSNAVGYPVKKTCDTGVSGSAVFAMSATVGEAGRFVFPSVTLACNGPAVTLPALPIFATTVTLHEATAATGATAAADTVFNLPPPSAPVTIHNTKAAAAATPTPVVVLARTGGGIPPEAPPMSLALVLLGLALLAVASIRRSKRSR